MTRHKGQKKVRERAVTGAKCHPQKEDDTPKRCRISLNTPADVARFQARCIRRTLTGGPEEAATLYKCACISAMLLKSLESSVLESRLRKVEDKLHL
jgi:hypothetical protein